MQLHIIYTETDILISKRPYKSCREIQDEHVSYKTSLGPWEPEEVIDYLSDDYPGLLPPAKEQVETLLVMTEETKEITFRKQQSAIE